jgi:hypothetical protein
MHLLKNLFSIIIGISFVNSGLVADAYPSKEVVQYGCVTIQDFYMYTSRQEGKVIHADPGESIQASCAYKYQRGYDCTLNQIVFGYDKGGAQKAIRPDDSTSEGYAQFKLIAPMKPGIYEVRFRYAQASSKKDAITSWWDVDGPPNEKATIGIVVVEADPLKSWISKLSNENMHEYLAEMHPVKKSQLDESLEPILTTDMIDNHSFWLSEDAKGAWNITEQRVSIGPSSRYNEVNSILSRGTYQQIDIEFMTKHTITNPTSWNSWGNSYRWDYARGLALSYYVDEKNNVEFRYFPDVQQASLYIRDADQDEEHIVRMPLRTDDWHAHKVTIQDGWITWLIDDRIIFKNKYTSLKQGKIRLSSHNNRSSFKF